MHGGAKGSGAPRGNRNAWRHGEYSAARQAELSRLRTLLAELRADAKRLLES
jgi:glucans biosynthesis protein